MADAAQITTLTTASPADTVLVGGHLIDPAQGLDGPWNLAIRDGRIAAVLPPDQDVPARQRIDVRGKLVIPGMIDTHAHVFQHVTCRLTWWAAWKDTSIRLSTNPIVWMSRPR